MDEDLVVSKIVSVARKAVQSGETMSRADLVYELRDCGVSSDSEELSELLWKAHASGNDCVRRAFVTNVGDRSAIDDIALTRMLSSDDEAGAMVLFNRVSDDCGSALKTLRSELKMDVAKPDAVEEASTFRELLSDLIGIGGIEQSKRQAGHVFERYSRLVGCYEAAKSGVRNVVHDFVAVRADLEKRYRRHVMELLDVFGDAVKAVDPQLFDYDSIQWIDAKGLLQKRELQYSGVVSKCGALIGEVTDSFKTSLKSAAQSHKSVGGGEAGLVLAGLEMALHYAGASLQTTEVERQVLELRNDVKRDGMVIQGDLLRLAKVFKKVNDLHLPRAEAFYRNEAAVFSGVFKGLLNAVYSTPESRELRAERDRLLSARQTAMEELAVVREEIAHFRDFLHDSHATLSEVQPRYEEARSRKPKRPLFDIGGGYSRNLYEWNAVCRPVVEQYQRLVADIKLAEEDLAAAEKRLPGLEREVVEKSEALNALAVRLRSLLSVDDVMKSAVYPHLKDAVGLLRVAKSILESGLAPDEVRTVDVAADALALPDACSEQIGVLGESVSAICRVSADVTPREADACKSLVVAFTSWMQLENAKEAEKMNERAYAAEVERLREDFKKSVAALDRSAVALNKALVQINLASTPEERKRGMMALADVGDGWTDADWAAFFSGNRKIEL